jgi:hypothetical protein
MEEIAKSIAAKRKAAVDYNSQTGTVAARKRWKAHNEAKAMPSASQDAQGIDNVGAGREILDDANNDDAGGEDEPSRE